METEDLQARKETRDASSEVMWEVLARAQKAYEEAKKQADIVHKDAKKLAVDKEAKKAVDEAHKEAVKQAEKVRDAITQEAQAVFAGFWKQRDVDSQEATAKLKERTEQAKIVHKEAKEQADIVHKDAKKLAVDKEAEKAADETRKESRKQAQKDYDEATT